MSAREPESSPQQQVVPHPIRVAVEARDYEAMARTLAPNVVARSPVTATPFVGQDAIDLLRNVLEAVDSWECLAEVPSPEFHLLLIRVELAGRSMQYVDVMYHDANGLIKEIVVYGRPLSDVALFGRFVGPKMARRQGRLRALAVAALTRPLPALLRVGDALVRRLGLNPGRAP